MPKTIAITGSTGFVGSNVAAVLLKAGHRVVGLGRRPSQAPWEIRVVDFDSIDSISKGLESVDAVIHAAIANDFTRLIKDREFAYDNYVLMTQRVALAALENAAQMVYISTDWVLDGTQHLSSESNPGNPVNFYGYLKAMGEQVVRDLHPRDGAICRISGVMGQHQLQDEGPRSQDVGFGYFVHTLVTTLKRGEVFTVWNGPNVNAVAAPSLAAEIGAQIERVVARRVGGTFHLVGDNAVGRFELAQMVCDVFGLDKELLAEGLPPESELFPAPVPVDSSLSNYLTKQRLGIGSTTLLELLHAFRQELESGIATPITQPE